jgi:hypothetical protein
MEIGQWASNRDEKGRPKCFNCNKYGHMAKEWRGPKQNKGCFNCEKDGHMTKDCRAPKKAQIRSIEEGNKQGFSEGSE